MGLIAVKHSDSEKNTAIRVLENLSSAVLLFDQSLRLHYLNVEAERMFSSTARHLLGQSAAELFPHQTDLQLLLEQSLRTLQPFTQREIPLRLSIGEDITVDVIASPFSETVDKHEIVVEISQVDRLLRISRDEILLQQQNVTQQIVRGLAHEVKNPLGGLRGAAQLLEKKLPTAELKEYTQVIINEADRLKNLVDQLLGPRTIQRQERTNIHEILEYVRNLVLAEYENTINIRCDYDPSIPELTADPDQLIQAILNIVKNAVQALGGVGEIQLCTRIQRQYTIANQRFRLVIRVDIIDNGPGIPTEIRDRIFYPLVTGNAEGSGLGLSIAQSLIQQHSGIIECVSEHGKTTFSLFLPLVNN